MAKASKLNFESGEKMADEESEGSGGGSKKKLIMIIVAALILIIGIIILVYVFILSDDDGEEKKGPKTQRSEVSKEFESKSQTDVTQLLDPLFTDPKSYNINLADGKHYLSLEIAVAVEKEHIQAKEWIDKRPSKIKDMVITYILNLSTEDIRKRGFLSQFKMKLKDRYNRLFSEKFRKDTGIKDTEPVKEVYITKFILN